MLSFEFSENLEMLSLMYISPSLFCLSIDMGYSLSSESLHKTKVLQGSKVIGNIVDLNFLPSSTSFSSSLVFEKNFGSH